MKRITAVVVLAMFIFLAPLHVYAESLETTYTYTERYSDGSTLTVTIQVFPSLFRSTESKRGSKTMTFSKPNGSTAWTATLSGSFSYDGSKATCTASSCSISIQDSSFFVSKKSASKSGSSAKADFEMGLRTAIGSIQYSTYSMVLTCDGKGNLS